MKPTNKIWQALTTDSSFGTKIRSLDISDNPLKSIPKEVDALVNLKTLIASHCRLQKESLNLEVFIHLQQLDLNHNILEVDTIVTLPVTLLKLNLSFNHFSGVPSFISHLINLTEINLSSNRIESMVGIGALTSLTILLLDDNMIVEIPNEMSNLKKLKKISLKNNRIGKRSVTTPNEQSIPESFFIDTPVDSIDLTGNPLKNTEINQFKGLDIFHERNKLIKEKALQGGALLDFSVFGLA